MADDHKIWQKYLNGEIKISAADKLHNNKNTKPENTPEKLTLDLHHLTEESAFIALVRAVTKAHNMHIKTLEVITGTNSKNGKITGVLYQNLPLWLNYSKISPYIKSFSRPKHNQGVIIIKLVT
jgi:DNA-nicking Smr family endonuclease